MPRPPVTGAPIVYTPTYPERELPAMSGITRRQALSVTAAAVAAAIALPQTTFAQATGYTSIATPVGTASADKVEVLEFLWLGCPHCYRFEPHMLSWVESMPEHAAFVREAPPLNPSWEPHSRGFYASRVLGIEDAFVEAMFKAIHQDRKNMRKPKDIAELAASLGADEDEFLKTMDSFSVETAMRRSIQLAVGAGLTGVPSVVVNGKYLTTGSLAGSSEGIIKVIDQLVAVEKEAMGL